MTTQEDIKKRKLEKKLNKICKKLDKMENCKYPPFYYEAFTENKIYNLQKQRDELITQLEKN